MRRALLILFLVVSHARGSAWNDAAVKLIEQGDRAARADRHGEAIQSYERAIQQDAGVREGILPKLARQYLWNDQPETAAKLFREVLQKHPDECDSRSLYALSLSWADHLRLARRAYQEVAEKCPGLATDAGLGEARVLRWMDRPSKADAIYRHIDVQGTPAQKRDAQIGLALTQLARDNNREARELFARLNSVGVPDSSVIEGSAITELHLGLPDRALSTLRQGRDAGVQNPRLSDLEEHVRRAQNLALTPSFTMFQDSDGTRYLLEDLAAGFGWSRRGQAEVHLGASTLKLNNEKVEGRWGGAVVEQRFNESWAVRADGRINRFLGADFSPVTGELDVVWTPSDRLRVDGGVARILIADNIAAMKHRLSGTFTSLGADARLTDQDTLSGAIDRTRWSEGNTRLRYRFALSHRFEGVPRLTVSWPTLFQTYDRGFSFGLFSPPHYLETGPSLNASRRVARYWTLFVFGRVGGQKESDNPWRKLGTVRVGVERELWKNWAFTATTGYSSSNLDSPTGFKRKSFSVAFTRRL